ncbi:penicillin-binding protein [Sphingomonas sp. Leaf33]|uniref:transglycosylase domain-containing protein n=1 Tax=Sphingomonas sp. Leaf33 TaxID=1736215 RepID=UPI0006F4D738|nr:transglycosylase domain-containing protein [Sphingomonas sp. Leaf33]KQN25105.1 penicillin-binding protein [Sphingomonas sp. Leaf33]
MNLGPPFDPSDRRPGASDDDPFANFARTGKLSSGTTPPAPPPGDPLRFDPPSATPKRRIRWGRWIVRGTGVAIVLLVVAIIWLAITAPLSRSLKPPTPPSITLLASDGKTPIARRGAVIGDPVDVRTLPKHIPQAFLAIEDRRFYSHWGVSPRGIARAMWNNARAGGMREGGSTITQQLAKNAFLSSDRTFGRKARELMISFWLEAWLTKDEILSRYLSNAYFGDNVYGLSAAAKHYFSKQPEQLSVAQAALLAGLVKAPSRLAPTINLSGARARQKLVVGAMVESGFLTKAEAADVGPARLKVERTKTLPSGTYFADWVLPQARDRAGEIANELTVTTTLDQRMQRAAERAIRRAGLREAQAALVAMRPDGTVVAMVGGKDYAKSPFNRAVQAKRQPGSTFKLFVYLAALRSGMTPESTVEDRPVTIGEWSPKNSDGRYAGDITLARAFAKSSNVAAARLTKEVGVSNVIRAARDLGVTSPIPNEASIALGTSTMSLLELTSAYAAIAAGEYPVRARGLSAEEEAGFIDRWRGRRTAIDDKTLEGMRELLSRSIASGTGQQAALSITGFGKTGTTQDSRDALFVGYAQGLVAGVWVGNDDNSPNPGLQGGGIPARIWRDFMIEALGVSAPLPAVIEEPEDPVGNMIDDMIDPSEPIFTDDPAAPPAAEIEGLGLNVRLGRDGSFNVGPSDRRRDGPPPRREDRRAPEDEDVDGPG